MARTSFTVRVRYRSSTWLVFTWGTGGVISYGAMADSVVRTAATW